MSALKRRKTESSDYVAVPPDNPYTRAHTRFYKPMIQSEHTIEECIANAMRAWTKGSVASAADFTTKAGKEAIRFARNVRQMTQNRDAEPLKQYPVLFYNIIVRINKLIVSVCEWGRKLDSHGDPAAKMMLQNGQEQCDKLLQALTACNHIIRVWSNQ